MRASLRRSIPPPTLETCRQLPRRRVWWRTSWSTSTRVATGRASRRVPRRSRLAQLVDTLPGLRLRGLLCYDGGAQHVTGFADRRRRALGSLEAAAETAVQMTRAGLDTGIFSGGGTGTYNIDHETSGLTDVQVGSYVFMDAQYLAIGGAEDPEVYTDFETALTVLTTVLNAQYAGRATTDAGAKANTINRPWPVIAGETGMTYTRALTSSGRSGTRRTPAGSTRWGTSSSSLCRTATRW